MLAGAFYLVRISIAVVWFGFNHRIPLGLFWMRFQKNPLLFSIADLLFEVRVKWNTQAEMSSKKKPNSLLSWQTLVTMESLPPELYLPILSSLSPHDLYHVGLASKRLFAATDDPQLWTEAIRRYFHVPPAAYLNDRLRHPRHFYPLLKRYGDILGFWSVRAVVAARLGSS